MNLLKKLKYRNDKEIDKELKKLQHSHLPRHIAIIMDGNGRWAKKRNLPRVAGHRQGVEALRDIIKTSKNLGIEYLTLYAFSTENWKRPKSEISALMSLLVEYLQKEIKTLHNNNIKINVIGDISILPSKVHDEIVKAINLTKNNDGLTVSLALNYGGRAEIIKAVKDISREIVEGKLQTEDIDENLFSRYLYTKDIPDPDLLIRTSGENRLSNFLLYQIAYSELVFTNEKVNWPDFNTKIFIDCINVFQNRKRRFGSISIREDEN